MGKLKGRRLKRYLGLRRSPGIQFRGGIDRVLPSKLMGWVMTTGSHPPFYEVRLLVGPHLIARAEINQSRQDVCEELGIEANPGFVLPVPVDLPPLDLELPVRVVAVSVDGSSQAELNLLQKKANTEERLRALLKSNECGMDGHVDGIFHGDLVGWAGRRGQLNPVKIWLQAEGQEPIGLICSQWREGMSTQQMPNECGFSQTLSALPQSWSDQRVWCSFDKDGFWHIPQEQALFVPPSKKDDEVSLAHQDSKSVEVTAISYADQLALAPENLQDHWRELEEFSLFLDSFEEELSRLDSAKAHQAQLKTQSQPWFGWLLRQMH